MTNNLRALIVTTAVTFTLLGTNSYATGQISDIVTFNGKTYRLIGISGELPSAQTFGMEAEPMSSANWRGYIAEYRIEEGQFELTTMTINAKSGNYNPINGIRPDLLTYRRCSEDREGEEVCATEGLYADLNLKIAFTGKLRLARDFIQSLYAHMGFQKPSAFREIYDLTFESGLLTGVIDRSRDAEKIRGQFLEKYQRDTTGNRLDVANFLSVIGSAFSLEMEPLQ